MATKSGVGISKEPDSFKAGVEAANAAFLKAGTTSADFILVAATIGHDQQLMLDGVRSVTKDIPLAGCSTFGIVTQEGTDEALHRVEVIAISSDKIRFTPVLVRGLKDNSLHAGEEAAKALNAVWPENPKALLIIADGITINPDALFRGIEANIKAPLPFVGGTAAESFSFTKTYQYFNGEALNDSVCCVILSGDFEFEIGISHGSEPIGITKTITKAEGNHLFEIDNKPAFEVFKEFLGPDIKDLTGTTIAGVCLGVEVPPELKGKYEDIILRIPTMLDPTDNSMYMAAEWPVGTKIFICRRDPASIIRRANEIAAKVKEHSSKQLSFVLHFDCAGRSKSFIGAETAQKEVAGSQMLGAVPWFGFYTYGEIAPIGGKNNFHNWTSVLFAIYES